MASTSEELSSQAEVLQSTIGFFKTGDTHPARKSQGRKLHHGAPSPAKASGAPLATTAGLAKMRRAVESAGVSIDLDSKTGGADARDRDFAPYEG